MARESEFTDKSSLKVQVTESLYILLHMHISDPFRLPLLDPPPFPHRTLTPWGIYTWRSLGKRVTPVMAQRQCASCSFYCCDKEQR